MLTACAIPGEADPAVPTYVTDDVNVHAAAGARGRVRPSGTTSSQNDLCKFRFIAVLFEIDVKLQEIQFRNLYFKIIIFHSYINDVIQFDQSGHMS